MSMLAGMVMAVLATSGPVDGPAAAAPPAPVAERGELVTDRPDFTESSVVVGKGIWQLETGAAYVGDAQGARAFAAPQALLRLGLTNRFELRLGASGFLAERQTLGANQTVGGSDFELGAKFTVLDQAHHGVALAIIPIVSLPVGSDGIFQRRRRPDAEDYLGARSAQRFWPVGQRQRDVPERGRRARDA